MIAETKTIMSEMFYLILVEYTWNQINKPLLLTNKMNEFSCIEGITITYCKHNLTDLESKLKMNSLKSSVMYSVLCTAFFC